MVAMTKTGKLSILLGILLFVFLTYPFMHIFNRDFLIAGIPLLALYLFGVWIWAIVALFALGRRFNVNR
jgi:hypothetical protein